MKRILIVLLLVPYLRASEYIYPVAKVANRPVLYLIYQKSPHHIELWEWDYNTNYAFQMLLSRFTPAGLSLLPDEGGFSFVDNGIIKIKQFLKRSPRSLELDAPIGHVELLHWVTNKICFTSGQYQDYFGIFQIDYEGMVYPLVMSPHTDCLYPQKVNDRLFFIARDDRRIYQIVETLYDPQGINKDKFPERLKEYEEQCAKSQVILDYQFQPIVFLHMVSCREGYVLAHPRALSKKDKRIRFSCHQLTKKEKDWCSKELFSFSIPTQLLFTGNYARLYEALLPLIPLYDVNYIYYVDCKNGINLNTYKFDRASKKSKRLTNSQGEEQFFGLALLSNKLIYGGRLCDNLPGQLSGELKMGLNKGFIEVLMGVNSF